MTISRPKGFTFFALLYAVLLSIGPATATELTAGTGPITPDQYPLDTSGPLGWYPLDGRSGVTMLGLKSSSYGTLTGQTVSSTGGIVMEAITDPANVFCANCVDIIMQIQNDYNSAANITRIELSGVSGYRTAAGYDVNADSECGPADSARCNATFIPDTVDRLTADTIGFNFATGGGITPRGTTYNLVIETNALTVSDPAGLSVFASDGSSISGIGNVFVPSGAPAVPLPATAWLMFSSLGGLATCARKRR